MLSDLKRRVQHLPSGARSTVISFRASDLKRPTWASCRRCAQQTRSNKTHYLITQDSVFENTGLSEGATLADAAQRMLEFGAVDAMNLDGGGSTQLFTGAGALVRPSDTRGVSFASYDRLIPTAILFS